MSGPENADSAALRDHLHDANDELSIATMQLELLLETGGLDEAALRSVREALEACRSAAAVLRQAWAALGGSGEV